MREDEEIVPLLPPLPPTTCSGQPPSPGRSPSCGSKSRTSSGTEIAPGCGGDDRKSKPRPWLIPGMAISPHQPARMKPLLQSTSTAPPLLPRPHSAGACFACSASATVNDGISNPLSKASTGPNDESGELNASLSTRLSFAAAALL
ncbi:unnamed protein product [Hapterophycus canaliculatus]